MKQKHSTAVLPDCNNLSTIHCTHCPPTPCQGELRSLPDVVHGRTELREEDLLRLSLSSTSLHSEALDTRLLAGLPAQTLTFVKFPFVDGAGASGENNSYENQPK